jgi:hypothetical protein
MINKRLAKANLFHVDRDDDIIGVSKTAQDEHRGKKRFFSLVLFCD